MEGSLEQRLARVEAQLAIQQLASRYARSVDSRDIDAVGALFSDQTRFGDFGMGPEGARAFYVSVLRAFYRSMHQIVGHVIDVDGEDSATGTVYCRAEHEDGDKWVVILMVYFDRYVRQADGWRFLARRPRYLYVGDVRDTPRAVDFALWPGRPGKFAADLPQSDESWGRFWAAHPEDQARVTTLP
ncbi:MAG: nuclear transport factor 2 family protein [Novosphingobium sp.]|nr:nuclear transport factor 2 family protein [Novosphingobium sp.]